MSEEKVEVAIIGAGWYGLAAAKTWLTLRPTTNLLILDDDESVGGVWSRKRLYPNLNAQVKLGLFNYSDLEMPAHPKHRDGRVSGQMIHEYMQKYAEEHDLVRRIRFNTFVSSATPKPGGGWRLQVRGSDRIIDADKIMVCTGVTSIPSSPDYAGLDQTSMPVLHSKDLGEHYGRLTKDEKIHSVVVVGAAKSAYDVVYLLLSMGKRVTWVIREEGAGPLAILPSKVLGLVSCIAVASTRLMTFLSPSILNTKGYMHWLMQQSTAGQWVVGKFWDTLAWLSDLHAGYGQGDHIAVLRPEISRQSIFWANSGLGVVTLADFWGMLHRGDLHIHRDTITNVGSREVQLASGTRVEADGLVLCTGWGDHFSMFSNETKATLGLPIQGKYSQPTLSEKQLMDSGGNNNNKNVDWKLYDVAADAAVDAKLPFLSRPPAAYIHHEATDSQRKWRLYRRCVPISSALSADRSITIMGQIHTVQTPLVAEVQSFWAVLYLLGRIEIPEQDDVMREIAEWNAWTRKRYLSQGQKFPYSLYDFMPYVDTLFADLGLNSFRKSNAIAEMFEPYSAKDFRGFIEEYLTGTRECV